MAEGDKKHLALEICAPDRAPIRLDVVEVSLPGTMGVFVVLPGHAPLLSTLDLGVSVAVTPDGEQHCFALTGGFAQVLNNRVLVLSQTAEMDTEIDIGRAQASLERAQQRLKQADPNIDLARAECALKRALLRVQAHGRSTAESALSGAGIVRK